MVKRYYHELVDFHYDDSGYYGYIVFNGGRDELRKLLQALGQGEQANGLGWYRYGKSFRPANDGRVYEFYIRLFGGGESRPSAQKVDEFFRKLFPPRDSHKAQGKETLSTSAHREPTPRWATEMLEHLLSIQSTLHDDLANLRQELATEQESAVAHREEAQSAREALGELQERYHESRNEFHNAEQTIADLRSQIEKGAPPDSQQWYEECQKLEKLLKDSKGQNKTLNQEKGDLKRENKQLKRDSNKWKNLYQTHNQHLAELNKQQEAERDQAADAERGGKLSMQDFESIIKGVFPNLRLLQDSLESVYYGVQNYRSLMRLLARIAYEPEYNGRNTMKNARKWREDRFDKEWRIYFCKEPRLVGDKVLALIGDKNSQSNDEKWLTANPPDSL